MRATLATILATFACLVLLAASLRYIHPHWATAIIDSLMTYATATAAVVALLAYALARRPVFLGIAAAGIGLAVHSVVLLEAHATVPMPIEHAIEPDLRILSFNMLYTNVENATRIADRILSSKADIAVVLEGGPMFMQLTRLSSLYPYRIGCGAMTPTCDLIVFSRTPLRDPQVSNLSDIRLDRFMSATITRAGMPIRVVAAHLSKPYFDTYHTAELTTLRSVIGNDRGPMILAGDFNSATIAPDMLDMLRGLDLNTASPEPPTWPVALAKHGLGIAIDHIYSRLPLVPLSVERLEDPFGSNHYGLFGTYIIRRG